MHVPFTAVHGSIRFSLSRYNTDEEIDEIIEVLPQIVRNLRKLSPYWDVDHDRPRPDAPQQVSAPQPRAKQLPLFGEPPAEASRPKRAHRRVGPAAVPDDLRTLAEQLPRSVWFGTSSWSFPGWAGLLYDRKATTSHLARHGLAAYAQHPLLRAAGIDRTYYAPISTQEFAAYAEAVPDDFRFLVKAASKSTDPHVRGERGRSAGGNDLFLDPGFAGDEVVGPYVEGLGGKAGVLLFQFPPLGSAITNDPARFAEALARFLTELPSGPLYAVELRDRDLLGEHYVAALREAGALHCYTAHPRMPSVVEQRRVVGAQDTLVGRWMLHSGLGYEAARDRYAPYSKIVDEDPGTRSALADLCVEQIASGGPVIVTANNKAEGSAPETLFRLAGMIVELFRERSQENT